MFNRFGRTPAYDGQTDRQTDTGPRHYTALAKRRAGKNNEKN